MNGMGARMGGDSGVRDAQLEDTVRTNATKLRILTPAAPFGNPPGRGRRVQPPTLCVPYYARVCAKPGAKPVGTPSPGTETRFQPERDLGVATACRAGMPTSAGSCRLASQAP